MNVQFKKGVLELCVLCSLLTGDKYGYELVSHVSQGINMAEGSVYPILKRLSGDGLLSTYLQESPEGPPRKYYSLTQSGKEHTEKLRQEWYEFAKGVNFLIWDSQDFKDGGNDNG